MFTLVGSDAQEMLKSDWARRAAILSSFLKRDQSTYSPRRTRETFKDRRRWRVPSGNDDAEFTAIFLGGRCSENR